jgi:hypothetical protein
MGVGLSFLVQKPVMSKKKVFVARNLKDSYQIYHSDQEKEKRKSKFFIRTILCFPDSSRGRREQRWFFFFARIEGQTHLSADGKTLSEEQVRIWSTTSEYL